jgi:hypothetical protein
MNRDGQPATFEGGYANPKKSEGGCKASKSGCLSPKEMWAAMLSGQLRTCKGLVP